MRIVPYRVVTVFLSLLAFAASFAAEAATLRSPASVNIGTGFRQVGPGTIVMPGMQVMAAPGTNVVIDLSASCTLLVTPGRVFVVPPYDAPCPATQRQAQVQPPGTSTVPLTTQATAPPPPPQTASPQKTPQIQAPFPAPPPADPPATVSSSLAGMNTQTIVILGGVAIGGGVAAFALSGGDSKPTSP